jgi:hypothetical protein
MPGFRRFLYVHANPVPATRHLRHLLGVRPFQSVGILRESDDAVGGCNTEKHLPKPLFGIRNATRDLLEIVHGARHVRFANGNEEFAVVPEIFVDGTGRVTGLVRYPPQGHG